MNDAASWLTTSARCARRRPGVPATRPDPAMARTGSATNPSRGAHANSSAIAIEIARVKPSTRTSSVISPVRLVKREV
jgi:hypothetical protein